MSRQELKIRSRLGDYTVYASNDFDFMPELAKLPNLVLLADRNVWNLYAGIWERTFGNARVYLLNAEEEHKNLDEVQKIYSWIIEHFSAKRNLNFVSFGGGITQDISGFVASTLFRGINWTYVPTTLLAQVDSCIGGKTSLNFNCHKNLLGSFYPPRSIYINSAFTETLSTLDMSSGYGEIVKFLLMRGFERGKVDDVAGIIQQMRSKGQFSNITMDCLNIKRSFMEDDEFDRGRRNLLNYGHCFGHALESASHYYVPHGVAVNIGVIFANLAAVSRGMLPETICGQLINQLNLPLLEQKQRQSDYDGELLLENLKNDKKRTGSGLPLVVPDLPHRTLLRLNDFSEAEFRKTLEQLKQIIFTQG